MRYGVVFHGGEEWRGESWWLLTDAYSRVVALFDCRVNADVEGVRAQAKDAAIKPGRIVYWRVVPYDPTARGEFASCAGPDLSGLSGWLPER